jgi:hypothetical protein
VVQRPTLPLQSLGPIVRWTEQWIEQPISDKGEQRHGHDKPKDIAGHRDASEYFYAKVVAIAAYEFDGDASAFL